MRVPARGEPSRSHPVGHGDGAWGLVLEPRGVWTDDVADEVNAALATLDPDDKDYARLQGWLEDLSVVKGGGVPGKF